MKVTFNNTSGYMLVKMPKKEIKKESVSLFGQNINCSTDSLIFYPSLKSFSCEDEEIENKYNNNFKLIEKLCNKWKEHITACQLQ